MIKILTGAQIQKIANNHNKFPELIEKDYALEWLLYGIYHKNSPIRDLMFLKGGTALSKIFFPGDWRFSEDLDFTIPLNTDPEILISGFEKIYDILENESGIIYEGKMNVPPRGHAIMCHLRFDGPLLKRTKIKVDISRIEKMAEPPITKITTPSYDDIGNFLTNSYTLNEVAAEKIRAMMRRTRARDYYDVWKLLGGKMRRIDTELIGDMVVRKCTINNMEYAPSKIFEPDKEAELEEYWKRKLEHFATEDLPDLKRVFSEIKDMLAFLPPK